MKGTRIAAGVLLAACVSCPFSMAQEPESGESRVLGSWLDAVGTAWRQTITITRESGVYYRTSTFHNGERHVKRLAEVPGATGRRFKDVGSTFGDAYEINADGWLDLYDRDGFIRTARPVDGAGARARAGEVARRSVKSAEPCYDLGFRYERCAAMAASGRQCDPRDDIAKPARCRNDREFDRGLASGMRLASED